MHKNARKCAVAKTTQISSKNYTYPGIGHVPSSQELHYLFAPGLQDFTGSWDDERSERTRSVPSVASRRVAAPYGVDDLALKTVDFKQKSAQF